MEFLHTAGQNRPMSKWIIGWIIIQILLPHPVGTNPMSRMATMAAICSENRFEITSYIRLQERYDWTVDWSRTPDGRYFSNKAPGAALLAAPLFCLVDRFYGAQEKDVTLRTQKQYRARWAVTWIASLLLQILPMAFLVFWIDGSLAHLGYSDRLRRFVQIALLFGHTGAIYMNSWWGHGLSVVLGLATFLTLQSKRWITAGFMFGLALLNDYSMALMIPGFLAILWVEKENRKDLGLFILGGIVPGLLWILYHTTSFGSPFTLPNAFQNPLFLDLKDDPHTIGGLFVPYPRPLIVLKLLFWNERGLLFTQPWILVVLFLIAQKKYRALVPQTTTFFVVSSFILLFWMNASFGGWHGGNTVGPRYMSPIFPFFALWLIPVFDHLSEKMKKALEIGLIVSLILFIASNTISIEPPTPPLWLGFYRASLDKDALTLWLRFLIQIIVLGVAFKLESRQRRVR